MRDFGDSTGAALGRGCPARCVQRHMPWFSYAVQWRCRSCSSSTMSSISQSWHRGFSHGLILQQTIEIHCCSVLTMWSASCCASPACSSGADVEKTFVSPQLQLAEAGLQYIDQLVDVLAVPGRFHGCRLREDSRDLTVAAR